MLASRSRFRELARALNEGRADYAPLQDESFMSGPDPLLKAILFSANSTISPVWCVDTEFGDIKTPQRDITYLCLCIHTACANPSCESPCLTPPSMLSFPCSRGRHSLADAFGASCAFGQVHSKGLKILQRFGLQHKDLPIVVAIATVCMCVCRRGGC